LCRSAYTDAHEWVANVQNVGYGDVIHFYFAEKKFRPLGAFEVIDVASFKSPKGIPTSADFGGVVDGCVLHEVVNASFLKTVDPYGAYQPDPKLGVFTGWLLRKIDPKPATAP